MTMIRSWLLIIAAGVPAGASAQASREWVAQGSLPGLVVGYEQHNAQQSIVERVPAGETVDRWTRMVTNQRFAGLMTPPRTIEDWMRSFQAGMNGGCPGARFTRRNLATESRPAVELRVDCPINPATGLPESFFMRAIAGPHDLHVVQVAFRHVPTPADVRMAQSHLMSVHYCDSGMHDARCTAAQNSPGAR